ncbi:MAG: T9SS type A sorting domain-containing protein [Cyclobacteriaceae bacterium]
MKKGLLQLTISMICLILISFDGHSQCSPTHKTDNAKSSFTGTLGTDTVKVIVTPPSKDKCLAYGLCTTYNLHGFRVDSDCKPAFNINEMWNFNNTNATKKIATLTTTDPANKCSNLPIHNPTLTLTIADTSNYHWIHKNGLVYVELNTKDTLVFTISETDQDSTTQINNYFNNCEDTSLHTCSSLGFYFYNNPNLAEESPIINQSDSLLTADHSYALSYQWYHNGQPIEGENSESFICLSSGNYHVEVSLASGCATSSEEITFVKFEEPEEPLNAENKSQQIWPNPIVDVLNITVQVIDHTKTRMDIIDKTGRNVYSKKNNGSKRYWNERIDLTHLKPGLYFIKIQSSNKTSIQKIFKS